MVANFGRRNKYDAFYNVESKLRTGFARAGHNVIGFSERDAAEEASPFASKWGGVARMRRRLTMIASHYRPHLMLFGHADLLDGETFDALRKAAPEARLAQFNVDSIHRVRTMAGFAARARHVDVSFITTADGGELRSLAPRPGTIRYFPNPVDTGVETGRVFESPRTALNYDGQFLGTGIGTREAQILDIEARLPDGFRFNRGGRSFGARSLQSVAYLEALCEAAMTPNLPLDDAIPVPFLYSSDRIAQLLGQGVAVLTSASARLDQVGPRRTCWGSSRAGPGAGRPSS